MNTGVDSVTSPPKLLDRVRHKIRLRYSIRTEQAYVDWIKRFILFHGKRHPESLAAPDVEAFLTQRAVERKVAAATQNLAKSSILFLYRDVLGRLYGRGIRIMEGVRFRVKDVDFARREILIRDGKGFKERVTVLPRSVAQPLRAHLASVQRQHALDFAEGFGEVWLRFALTRKYPAAGGEWGWQYVFPGDRRSIDPQSGIARRHHLAISVSARHAAGLCATPGSRSSQLRTRFDTRSRRTFWSRATTSGRCGSCSGTPTCRRPWSTRTCSTAAGAAW